MALCEKSVKGMAELMESSLYLIDGKKLHCILRLAEVADIDNDRTDILS